MKQSWVCVTLIDITNTGIKYGNSKERDQQRNWETVLQVLGLKTQPMIKDLPVMLGNINVSKVNYLFGEFYEGQQSLWAFNFYCEHNIYTLEQLQEDFEQVPVILGLDETARFMLPIFHSYGTLKNIHFYSSDELNIN